MIGAPRSWPWSVGIALGLAIAPAAAGGPFPSLIRSLTTQDGLSHDVVYTILRDRRGVMWFGTEDGLDRYDGHAFEHVHARNGARNRPSSGNVSHLLEDSEGAIWIATWGGGLNRFDPITETFEHFTHDPHDRDSLAENRVQRLLEDRSGRLWVGTYDGLDLLRREGQRVVFEHFRHDPADPNSLSASRIWSMSQGPEGDLWLGTDAGLDRFDPDRGRVQSFRHEPDQAASLSHDVVRALFHDPRGHLWVGTDQGLDRLEGASGTFVHYSGRSSGDLGRRRGTINAILEASDGSLWIGTQHQGMLRLDPGASADTRVTPGPDGLSHDDVRALFEDESGLLWVATRGGGIDVFDLQPIRFAQTLERPDVPEALRRRLVSAVIEDRQGELWVGTDRGLVRLSRDRGSVAVYRHDPLDPASLTDPSVKALYEDREGRLWIGTEGGLDSLDPTRESIDHHPQPAGTPLQRLRIEALQEDSRGALWVGTQGGLARYDPTTGRFLFSTFEGAEKVFVWTIFVDREDRIWVGTEFNGLFLHAPARGQFVPYRSDLPAHERPVGNRVTSIYQGAVGDLWLTTGDGLLRLDPETAEVERWQEVNGLPTDNLKCVLGDGSGGLWVSSSRGLSRVHLDSMAIRTFAVNQGLQGLVFSPAVCHRTASGRMHFGGLYGLNSFDAAAHAEAEVEPPLVLSSLSISGRAVSPQVALEAGKMILDPAQTTFAFEFTALDYRSPELVRYAYRLDGFDSGWIDSGSRRYAAYTNVPPGDYVFRARATDSAGQWREAAWSVPLQITPPVWQRWWFRTLAVLATLALALGLHRLRLRSVRRQSRRLERIVKQRTAEVKSEKRKLELVNSLVKLINAESHLGQLLEVILEGITFTEGAENALALILDRSSGRFEIEASFGWTEGLPNQLSFQRADIEDGYLAEAQRVGDGIWIGEPSESDLLAEQRRLDDEPMAILGLRIEIDGTISGYLLFGKRHDAQAFTSLEADELENLKEHVESAFRKGRMLEELRELNRTKNEFLGIAAHDLRSPLGGVIGYTDLLLRLLGQDPIDREDWRHLLGNVKLTAHQMLQLINSLLDVTAIEAGRLELKLEPTRLSDLVVARSDLHRRSAANKQIEIVVELEPDDVEVAVDRVRMGEVLDNLLSNAIKFTGEGGRVRLAVSAVDGEVQVEVQDSGVGLRAEEVAIAFSGRKLSARPTAGEPSTGLGLVIVKKIVEQHGGRVRAASRKGEGSTFGFDLPWTSPAL